MTEKLTLEELRQLIPSKSRARKDTKCETEAEEYKRLLANYKSRLYKQKLGENKKSLITEKDIRMYKACFIFERMDLTERSYIKRMTGLTDKQIYFLQLQTGLVGFPAVSKKEAH